MKKTTILALAMMLLAGWMNAQEIEFSVSLSADTIGLNNRLEVTFTLKNAQGARFEPPQFDGFRLLAGPNTSSQFSIVNGKTSSLVSYSYILEPLEVGQYYIQPAFIDAGGKTLETALQEVWVLPGDQAPARDKRNTRPQDIIEKPAPKRPITKM
jgi:hypothetical protein